MYIAAEWVKNVEGNLREIMKICRALEQRADGLIDKKELEGIEAYCIAAQNGLKPEEALQVFKNQRITVRGSKPCSK
jgi:hypothetical protein